MNEIELFGEFAYLNLPERNGDKRVDENDYLEFVNGQIKTQFFLYNMSSCKRLEQKGKKYFNKLDFFARCVIIYDNREEITTERGGKG